MGVYARVAVGVMVAVMLLGGAPVGAFAAGEGVQASSALLEISGKIAAVDPGRRTMALQEKWFGILPTGRTKNVVVDRDADISDMAEGQELRLDDLRPGDQVTVRYLAQGEANIAHEILVRGAREEAATQSGAGQASVTQSDGGQSSTTQPADVPAAQ